MAKCSCSPDSPVLIISIIVLAQLLRMRNDEKRCIPNTVGQVNDANVELRGIRDASCK